MNNLTFPGGITYKYKYNTAGDFIPANIKLINAYGLYACARNTVIDIQFDTSNVTDAQYLFYNCKSISAAPQFDTSNVTNMSYMFEGCSSLISIPQLDCSKSTSARLFGYNASSSIVNLGGFKNLGMQKSVSETSGNYFLGGASKLTHESIMNVINNLYDRAAAGYSVLTLKLNATTLALLSDEEKAIATNKGWTLA